MTESEPVVVTCFLVQEQTQTLLQETFIHSQHDSLAVAMWLQFVLKVHYEAGA